MMSFDFNAEMMMPATAKLGLKERLSQATPGDTLRGLFFNGVMSTVRSSADEEAVRRCRVMLRQSTFFDFFSYSIFDFLRLAFTAAQYISPRQGSFDAGLRRLGQQGMRDFLASMAGKTFLSFSGTDARRMLTNLPVLFRTAVSYGERSVEWTGSRRCRFIMKRDFMPPSYQEGAIETALQCLHPKLVTVRSVPTGMLDSEYWISWE